MISFDPVGWGVPYGANMSRSGAPARVLEKAAQVLIVLLDHGPSVTTPPLEGDEGGEGEGGGEGGGAAEDAAAGAGEGVGESKGEGGGGEGASPPPAPVPTNVYRALLASLGRDNPREDFEPIYNGLVRLLSNVHESANVYLPGSVMTIECHQEVSEC